jgi:hypothetical protein
MRGDSADAGRWLSHPSAEPPLPTSWPGRAPSPFVGSSLFVTDDFSRTLRRIDLRTGDNDRVPLPESIHIFDLSDDGQGGLVLADSGAVWRLALPAGEVRLAGSRRSIS